MSPLVFEHFLAFWHKVFFRLILGIPWTWNLSKEPRFILVEKQYLETRIWALSMLTTMG